VSEPGKKVFVWGESYSHLHNEKVEVRQSVCFEVSPYPEGSELDGVPLCGGGASYPTAKSVREVLRRGYVPVLDRRPDGEYKPLSPENRRAFSFLE
jgi:hypothetical protein